MSPINVNMNYVINKMLNQSGFTVKNLHSNDTLVHTRVEYCTISWFGGDRWHTYKADQTWHNRSTLTNIAEVSETKMQFTACHVVEQNIGYDEDGFEYQVGDIVRSRCGYSD